MRALWNSKGLQLGNLAGSSSAVPSSQSHAQPDGLQSPLSFESSLPMTRKDSPPLHSNPSDSRSASASSDRRDRSEEVNPFDAIELPFTPARQSKKRNIHSSSASRDRSYSTSSDRHYAHTPRGASDSKSDFGQSVTSGEPSPASSSLFGGSSRSKQRGSQKSSFTSQGTAPGEDMLMEILSSQAIIESKEFEVLGWNELEALKKDHHAILNRISALQYKLNLELKMRDAVVLMDRGSGADGTDSLSSSTNGRQLGALTRSESIGQRLESASANIATVTTDLSRLQQKEADVRTRMLKHTAGVLSYVLSRREAQESADPFSAHSSTTEAPSKDVWRFEGPHLFAGNKDAYQPPPKTRARGMSSVSSSSRMDSPTAPPGLMRDLRRQLDVLQASHDALSEELQASRRSNLELTSELSSARAESTQSSLQLSALQRGHEQLQKAQQDAVQSKADAYSELSDLQSQLSSVRREKEAVDDQVLAVQANMAALQNSTQGEAGVMSARLAELEKDYQTALDERKEAQTALENNQTQLENQERLVADRKENFTRLQQSVNELAGKFKLPPLPNTRSRLESDAFDSANLVSWIDFHLGSSLAKSQGTDESSAERDELRRQLDTKEIELEEAQRARTEALSKSATLEQKQQRQRQFTHQQTQSETLVVKLQADLSNLESRLSAVTGERDTAKRQIGDVTKERETTKSEALKQQATLQELWKVVAADKSDERPDLPPTKLPMLRQNGPARNGVPHYTFEGFCERVRTLASGDKPSSPARTFPLSPSSPARSFRDARDGPTSPSQASSLQKTERELQDKQAALTSAQQQIADLEAYVQASTAKEVDMLEKLNEAQQQAESIRTEKRRLEASSGSSTAPSSSRIAELEAAIVDAERSSAQLLANEHSRAAQLENSLQAANSEVVELRDSLQDISEELNDSRERDQKSRMQLMDEIAQLGREASSLKSKLRQEQRKGQKSPTTPLSKEGTPVKDYFGSKPN